MKKGIKFYNLSFLNLSLNLLKKLDKLEQSICEIFAN